MEYPELAMTIKVSKLHAEKCVTIVLFHKTKEFPKKY